MLREVAPPHLLMSRLQRAASEGFSCRQQEQSFGLGQVSFTFIDKPAYRSQFKVNLNSQIKKGKGEFVLWAVSKIIWTKI